ncbi:MAG TPA: response regulator [Nitrococcus sp.]|nr:response regulator [Nitrococcus sp.]
MASTAATVLLVMKKAGNLRVMQQALDQLGYSGMGIANETQLQAALTEPTPPRLGVVDVTDFGACIWPMCACLQSHGIPFIVLSAPQALNLGNRSLAYGATSVLHKPIAKSALLQLIHSLAA